jgi:hypothetical protein
MGSTMVPVRSHLVVVKVAALALTALSFEERTTCTTSETTASGVLGPTKRRRRVGPDSGRATPSRRPALPAKLVVVNRPS